MATPFHNKVAHTGFHFEDSHLTWNLGAAVTIADVGKPMSLDPTGSKRAIVAADTKRIIGVLASFEDRNGTKVGTIALRYTAEFAVKAADALAVGDMVVGAGAGEVRKWASGNDLDYSTMVTDVTSGVATVLKV